MKPVDFFGRPLKAGDFFTMAYRYCNSAEAGVGIVKELRGAGISAQVAKVGYNGKVTLAGRRSSLGALDRLVIVPPGTFPPDIQAKLEAAK
jgi:hypothetical protein